MTAPARTRLAELAASAGEAVASAANLPVEMDDPAMGWFVEEGALDVFVVEYRDGSPASDAKHLLRAGPGRLVFGVGPHDAGLAITAKGLPNTELRRVRLEDLNRRDCGLEVTEQVDAWVSGFAAAVARQIEPRPPTDWLLERPSAGEAVDAGGPVDTGERVDARQGDVVSARPGGVVWIGPEDPAAAYLGTGTRRGDGTGLVPVTSDTWLTLGSAEPIAGIATSALHADGRLWAALAEFHRLVLEVEQLNRLLLLADEVNQRTAGTTHRRLERDRSRQSLFSVLAPHRRVAEADSSALMGALRLIARREGMTFRSPPRRAVVGDEPSLEEILDASRVRRRKIRLSEEDRWWLSDSGAMLGFRRDDGRPVALLPGFSGRYRAVDPATGRSSAVGAAGARDLDSAAWCFYRPLPEDRPVGKLDLLRVVAGGVASDLGRFVGAGLPAIALMLAPAIAVGVLVDWVLPTGAGGTLAQIAAALGALAVVGALLAMLQGTAMMRLEGRAAARLAAATWDRLLRLPASFFRDFTSGELAVRTTVFETLRDRVSGIVAISTLSMIFALPTLGLLFLYDATLAWMSVAVGLLALMVTALLGAAQIPPLRRSHAAARRLSGELFQFVNGMSKLRSAGAEPSALASWARRYRELHLAGIQVGRLNDCLVAFSVTMPMLAAAVLFGVALSRRGQLAVGDFLVVYAVSMFFYSTVTGVGRSFQAVAAAVPAYEQVKPILAAVPAAGAEGGRSAELSGDIHFDHVSFRYRADGPLIIDDISIRVRPGEFVAIVGESGAGKSTLVQLALGLEQPSSGGIYYDGTDLANLDSRSVRRQIGVVMQDGALQPGNILDNIIGLGDDLTIDDAWRAARMAAVDEDVAAMPMGMFTAVSDNSATFSGGQTQRIRIAAALVRGPRIMFLDEATSWLDARSQAEVMRGVESLANTRIVIAHRLSTIRKAERIYVLEAGRVVQQGSFDELFETEGTFRTLVLRQTI